MRCAAREPRPLMTVRVFRRWIEDGPDGQPVAMVEVVASKEQVAREKRERLSEDRAQHVIAKPVAANRRADGEETRAVEVLLEDAGLPVRCQLAGGPARLEQAVEPTGDGCRCGIGGISWDGFRPGSLFQGGIAPVRAL